jgi:hypothetical protein
MPYLIRNVDTGKFVASPGLTDSYTHDILQARQYPSILAASNDKCGNEHVVFRTWEQLRNEH